RIANIELKSQGVLENWQKEVPKYSAHVGGDFDDLGVLASLVEPVSPQLSAQSGAQPVPGKSLPIKPEHLSGKAQIEVDILGTPTDARMLTHVKAAGLTVQRLIQHVPPESQPFLYLIGLSDTSRLNGNIHISQDGRLEIENGQVPIPGGTIDAHGYFDWEKE